MARKDAGRTSAGAPPNLQLFDLVLVGFGNVAKRVVTLLDELRPVLENDYRFRTRVVGVVTRSHGSFFDPKGLTSDDLAGAVRIPKNRRRPGTPLEFLADALARSAASARAGRLIVVELSTLDIVDGQPAIDHVRAALRGGAHVVTANKGPAAFGYRALASEAARAGRCFLFESAVMDGIPVFNLKRAALAGVAITGFRGVVNSTTNYILTAMERGEPFADALAAMQRAGIAEADASFDVEGWDAAAKTAALANALMGADLTPHAVQREGISAAAAERIKAARATGRRVKLVASAERAGGTVNGHVRLVELPESDLLAQLEEQQNALVLQTDLLGELAIVQRGGGLTQTAYGVVSDIVSIARPSRFSTPRPPREARRGRNLSARGPQ
jgi:homoserine dehydrogenase